MVEWKELVDSIRLEFEKHNTINELLPISIFQTNSEFTYMKCLIDSLLELKPIGSIPDEFISLCQEEYVNNPIALEHIDQFEKEYSSDQALLCFRKYYFLSKILYQSFSNANIDLLFLSRFFLHDLDQQIKENQSFTSIEVYRSQLISKDHFEKLQNSIGGYILISSFFTANISRDQALAYLDYPSKSQQVLFEIQTNPTTSFCYSSNPEEILFNLGSIFHLTDIEINENQISIIRMRSSTENDVNWKSITDQIKTNENYWTTDLLLFGTILQEKKKYFEAEKFYRLLLNEFSQDHSDIEACYYSLGLISTEQDNSESSLKNYQLVLEILLRKNQFHHSHLAIINYKIGEIYQKEHQFPQALQSYNHSLKLWKETEDINQIKIIKCLNSIAFIYRTEKKYLEAISYYTEALHINEKDLPENDIDLGILNHNIGALHWCLGDYENAIKYYNLALQIKMKSVASQQPSMAMTLENLGLVYENNEDFTQAFGYYEQAAKIYRKILPAEHSDVIQIDDTLRRMSSKLQSY